MYLPEDGELDNRIRRRLVDDKLVVVLTLKRPRQVLAQATTQGIKCELALLAISMRPGFRKQRGGLAGRPLCLQTVVRPGDLHDHPGPEASFALDSQPLPAALYAAALDTLSRSVSPGRRCTLVTWWRTTWDTFPASYGFAPFVFGVSGSAFHSCQEAE